jgi:AcrR family transcriptional regulator
VDEGDLPCWQDPRIERTRRVVLEAAIALLIEGGYAAVTMEAVAVASGVAKSTIYRHWPSRVELVNDAFLELKPALLVPPPGDVRERLVVVLEDLAQTVADSPWSACLPTLIEAAEREPAARQLHARLCIAGRQSLADLLDEGVSDGQLPPDLDTQLIAEALSGPIILRRLMTGDPLPPEQVRHLVDQVLGGRCKSRRRTSHR